MPSHRTLAACIMSAAIVCAAIQVGCKDTSRKSSSRSSSKSSEEDCTVALAVANRLCQAWQEHNARRGKTLLTSRLLEAHSAQRIDDALGGTGNPQHVSYEISSGRSTGQRRYEFDVRLHVKFFGQQTDRVETVVGRVIVLGSDGGWLVDEFPTLLVGALDPKTDRD